MEPIKKGELEGNKDGLKSPKRIIYIALENESLISA